MTQLRASEKDAEEPTKINISRKKDDNIFTQGNLLGNSYDEPEVLINRSSDIGFCVPLLFPEADTSIS